MNGIFHPDPMRCDGPLLPPNFHLTHELGTGTAAQPFPANERIGVSATPSTNPTYFECDSDDGVQNDWTIRITNLSGNSWQDLYLVTDEFGPILGIPGQFDGFMENPLFPNDPRTPACRGRPADDARPGRLGTGARGRGSARREAKGTACRFALRLQRLFAEGART